MSNVKTFEEFVKYSEEDYLDPVTRYWRNHEKKFEQFISEIKYTENNELVFSDSIGVKSKYFLSDGKRFFDNVKKDGNDIIEFEYIKECNAFNKDYILYYFNSKETKNECFILFGNNDSLKEKNLNKDNFIDNDTFIKDNIMFFKMAMFRNYKNKQHIIFDK